MTSQKPIDAMFKQNEVWERRYDQLWVAIERKEKEQARLKAEKEEAERIAKWEAEAPAREAAKKKRIAEFWASDFIDVYHGNSLCAASANLEGVNLKEAIRRGYSVVTITSEPVFTVFGGTCYTNKYLMKKS